MWGESSIGPCRSDDDDAGKEGGLPKRQPSITGEGGGLPRFPFTSNPSVPLQDTTTFYSITEITIRPTSKATPRFTTFWQGCLPRDIGLARTRKRKYSDLWTACITILFFSPIYILVDLLVKGRIQFIQRRIKVPTAFGNYSFARSSTEELKEGRSSSNQLLGLAGRGIPYD